MKISLLKKVSEFILSLSYEVRGGINVLINLLEKSERPLSMPYSKSLGGGLFELRISSEIEVRIFYCYRKNMAHLLHGIIKKTQKTPKKEIDYARKMQKLIESL